MCDAHEDIISLVCFFIHVVVMYILRYKCIYTYYTLFLCLWGEEEVVKPQRQHDQQNIMLNKSSMIFPTNDEEMRHAHNVSNDNGSSHE
jgi:hypothetical protein